MLYVRNKFSCRPFSHEYEIQSTDDPKELPAVKPCNVQQSSRLLAKHARDYDPSRRRRRDIKRLCLKKSNFARQSFELIIGEAIFRRGRGPPILPLVCSSLLSEDLHSSSLSISPSPPPPSSPVRSAVQSK